MKEIACGGNTSEPVRSQEEIRHNRSHFVLPFIPFSHLTASEPDVKGIGCPEKNKKCFWAKPSLKM